jgi:hypothetical protein
MGLKRRELLAATAGSALLGGCVGVGVPSVPDPLGSGGEGTASATAGPTNDGTPATPAPTTTAASKAGEEEWRATERVFDELNWFASAYEPTVGAFLSLSGRVRNLCDSLKRKGSVSEGDLRDLRGLTDGVERVAYDRLGPHFDTEPTLRAFNDEHLERIETLGARNDWDGAAAALRDMAAGYDEFASRAYVTNTFPRDPVRGPLVDYLTAPGRADEAVVLAFHEDEDETVRAQRRRDAYPGRPAGGQRDVERYRRLYRPLQHERGRTGLAYVTVNDVAHGGAVTLQLQRYRSVERGRAAFSVALSDPVSVETTTSLGGREWRRAFYHEGSDVVYADVTRTGPFVVALGASRTPWADRDEAWHRPLGKTWLWR